MCCASSLNPCRSRHHHHRHRHPWRHKCHRHPHPAKQKENRNSSSDNGTPNGQQEPQQGNDTPTGPASDRPGGRAPHSLVTVLPLCRPSPSHGPARPSTAQPEPLPHITAQPESGRNCISPIPCAGPNTAGKPNNPTLTLIPIRNRGRPSRDFVFPRRRPENS